MLINKRIEAVLKPEAAKGLADLRTRTGRTYSAITEGLDARDLRRRAYRVGPLPLCRITGVAPDRIRAIARKTWPESGDRGPDRAAARHHAGILAADAGSLGSVAGKPTPRKAGLDSTDQGRGLTIFDGGHDWTTSSLRRGRVLEAPENDAATGGLPEERRRGTAAR